MATPIPFLGSNTNYTAPGNPAIGALPAHSTGEEIISCWKLSADEKAHVAATGEVWLSVRLPKLPPPVYLSGTPLMASLDPFTGEQVIYHSDGRHVLADARLFAALAHGDQVYDEDLDMPHTAHLDEAVANLARWGLPIYPFQVAAVLHDIEEDCWPDKAPEERRILVGEKFGGEVEGLVWAVTGVTMIDGEKQNRKSRNKQQYDKIAANTRAAYVKCGDRSANLRHSVRTRNKGMCAMYAGESLDFDNHVGRYVEDAIRAELLTLALQAQAIVGADCKIARATIEGRLSLLSIPDHQSS